MKNSGHASPQQPEGAPPVGLWAPDQGITPPAVEPGAAYVRQDLAWAQTWLAQHADSPKTFRGVRKELERFLAWWHDQAHESIVGLTVREVEAYKRFLQDPQPRDRWVANRKFPRASPHWRPFYGKGGDGGLSAESRAYSFTILKAFFAWLEAQDIIPRNPFRLTKKPKVVRRNEIHRLLPQRLITPICKTIEADENPRRQARDRFLFALFYTTGLRAFEAGEADMRQIQTDSQGRDWLHIIGKGNIAQKVPLTATVLEALAHYRAAYGLPPSISPAEDTPLVMPVRGGIRRASASTLLRAIRDIMQRTLVALPADQAALANQLQQATTHWLRHSRFSHLAQAGVPLLKIKNLARHASITTTNIYLHAEAADTYDMVAAQDLAPTAFSGESSSTSP